MKYDSRLLFEDVKFPLQWDTEEYKMYIFDANYEMVAQVDVHNFDDSMTNHPFEKILGNYKDDSEAKFDHTYLRFFLFNGDFYDQEEGIRIGCVRGWGRLQKKNNPEERQDNIANYILNVLNRAE